MSLTKITRTARKARRRIITSASLLAGALALASAHVASGSTSCDGAVIAAAMLAIAAVLLASPKGAGR